MPAARTGTGKQHLTVLARAPRPAGSAAERAALDYAARVLGASGFDVRREAFMYSAFPGRYGMPIGGALAGTSVVASVGLGLGGLPIAALAALAGGVVLTAAFAAVVLGDGVLTLPWLRSESENLVATRGGRSPSLWLVAHADSKSQPVPSLVRIAGTLLLAVAVLVALVAGMLQLALHPHRMAWWGACACAVIGALPVMASTVGAHSDGAVDNASGVAAVLAAAAAVRPDAPFGVLISSAEELGLAGARAWAHTAAIRGGRALTAMALTTTES
jgi:acetylornithine deacetylase/succinyl-diaminopimelate desuccinylase-like protein